MTRHRWAQVEADVPARHKGRCVKCGLMRQRNPGSHTTHYTRQDAEGRTLPVDSGTGTPPCAPEEVSDD